MKPKKKKKTVSFSLKCYLSKGNKSLEKFIIAVYLDRRNQHYVKWGESTAGR